MGMALLLLLFPVISAWEAVDTSGNTIFGSTNGHVYIKSTQNINLEAAGTVLAGAASFDSIAVTSTTKVVNLNSDFLDGKSSEEFSLKTPVDTLTGRVTANEGAITTLQSDVSSLEGRMDTAEATLATIPALQADVDDLKPRMDTVETAVALIPGLQTQVDALDTRLTALEIAHADTVARLTEVETILDDLLRNGAGSRAQLSATYTNGLGPLAISPDKGVTAIAFDAVVADDQDIITELSSNSMLTGFSLEVGIYDIRVDTHIDMSGFLRLFAVGGGLETVLSGVGQVGDEHSFLMGRFEVTNENTVYRMEHVYSTNAAGSALSLEEGWNNTFTTVEVVRLYGPSKVFVESLAAMPEPTAMPTSYASVLFQEQYANTIGPSAPVISPGYNVREVNTKVYDDNSLGSLGAGGSFHLVAGTFDVEFGAPGYDVDCNRAVLWNVDTDEAVLWSLSAVCEGAHTTFAVGRGRITLASPAELELRHYVQTSVAGGLGKEQDKQIGLREVFSYARFSRVPALAPSHVVIEERAAPDDMNYVTTATWNRRQLNTKVVDEGDKCTMSGNGEFVLAMGVYDYVITGTAYNVARAQLRLHNVDEGRTMNSGTPEYALTWNVNLRMSGRLTVTAAEGTRFAIDLWGQTGRDHGFGKASRTGPHETYCIAEFTHAEDPARDDGLQMVRELVTASVDPGATVADEWTPRGGFNHMTTSSTSDVGVDSDGAIVFAPGVYDLDVGMATFDPGMHRQRLFARATMAAPVSSPSLTATLAGTTSVPFLARLNVPFATALHAEMHVSSAMANGFGETANTLSISPFAWANIRRMADASASFLAAAEALSVGTDVYGDQDFAYFVASATGVVGTTGNYLPMLLNEERANDNAFASLNVGNGEVTLGAGTYDLRAQKHFWRANECRIRFDVGGVKIYGLAHYSQDATNDADGAVLVTAETRVALGSSTVVKVEYAGSLSHADGAGYKSTTSLHSTDGDINYVFGDLQIVKVNAAAFPRGIVKTSKAYNVDDGGLASKQWATKDLNLLSYNSDGLLALASSRVTVAPGWYRVSGQQVAYYNRVRFRLLDVNNNRVLGISDGHQVTYGTTVVSLKSFMYFPTATTIELQTITNSGSPAGKVNGRNHATLNPQIDTHYSALSFTRTNKEDLRNTAFLKDNYAVSTQPTNIAALVWTAVEYHTIEGLDQSWITKEGSTGIRLARGVYTIDASYSTEDTSTVKMRVYSKATTTEYVKPGMTSHRKMKVSVVGKFEVLEDWTVVEVELIRVTAGSTIYSSSGDRENYLQIVINRSPTQTTARGVQLAAITPSSSDGAEYYLVRENVKKADGVDVTANWPWTERPFDTLGYQSVPAGSENLALNSDGSVTLAIGAWDVDIRATLKGKDGRNRLLCDNGITVLGSSLGSSGQDSMTDSWIVGRVDVTDAPTICRLQSILVVEMTAGEASWFQRTITLSTGTFILRGASSPPQIVLQETFARETSGGSATGNSGEWDKRVMSALVNDASVVTIEGSNFKLPAGVYDFAIRAPCHRCAGLRIRLECLFGAVGECSNIEHYGTPVFSDASYGGNVDAWVKGQFSISEESVFSIATWSSGSSATDGWGRRSTFAREIYATATFSKRNTAGRDRIIIEEQTAKGIVVPAGAANTWTTRQLNFKSVDTGGHATVSGSNTFTLQPGNYHLRVTAPFKYSEHSQLRLVHVGATMEKNVMFGSAAWSQSTRSTVHAAMEGRLIVPEVMEFRVEQIIKTSIGNSNFGGVSSLPTLPAGAFDEMHCIAELWRE